MAYTDYGPNPYRQTRTVESPDSASITFELSTASIKAKQRWASRPLCDLCGPFRGRYLRAISGSTTEYGPEYRCKGCDEE